MLIFLNKGDNHQKWKTINLQHRGKIKNDVEG